MAGEAEIVGAAIALIEKLGFPAAKSRAREMTDKWATSQAPDAAEGLRAWERIQAYVDALEASGG